MNRIRLGTTADAVLLQRARGVRSGSTDTALVDEALAALLARHRSTEVDASYAAYDEHPLDEADEWGDLAVTVDCSDAPVVARCRSAGCGDVLREAAVGGPPIGMACRSALRLLPSLRLPDARPPASRELPGQTRSTACCWPRGLVQVVAPERPRTQVHPSCLSRW